MSLVANNFIVKLCNYTHSWVSEGRRKPLPANPVSHATDSAKGGSQTIAKLVIGEHTTPIMVYDGLWYL